MTMPLNRVEPRMPPEMYKTYAVVSPLSTHFRSATCAEVRCAHFENGWQVRIEGLTPELLYTAMNTGRRWRRMEVAEGETYLVFEAGQPCFKASLHRTRSDRPELFVVRDGDHRGNPRRTKALVHKRPEHWLEDFAGHQQTLADEIQKG